jgi:hypothetical protein
MNPILTPVSAPVGAPIAFIEDETLSPASIAALAEDAPQTLIDAMIVVVDSVLRRAGYQPEIDVTARTLTVESPTVRIVVRDIGGDRVGFTATRRPDGGLLAQDEAGDLGLAEIQAILFSQRYRTDA